MALSGVNIVSAIKHTQPPPPCQVSTWRDDLADGKSAERRIAAFFQLLGYAVEQSAGYAPGHDLTITGKIEVKHDRAALRTGNVAIETSCRGRPSGLAATQSAWWIFVVGDTAYAITTATLRRLVAGLRGRWMGDGLASYGHLLPLESLRRHARVIDLSGLPEGDR
ncbi:MAG: hypothetical protein ACP5QA_15900 [Phycisphaerae bacterium]